MFSRVNYGVADLPPSINWSLMGNWVLVNKDILKERLRCGNHRCDKQIFAEMLGAESVSLYSPDVQQQFEDICRMVRAEGLDAVS